MTSQPQQQHASNGADWSGGGMLGMIGALAGKGQKAGLNSVLGAISPKVAAYKSIYDGIAQKQAEKKALAERERKKQELIGLPTNQTDYSSLYGGNLE